MLIGVPVAFTPGFGPHDDVSVDPVLALAVVLELDALPPAAGALALLLLLLLLLLLPHAASSAAAMTAAKATPRRTRSAW
jgi:ABC-type transport system involved in cytochrome bd biosynthesis fused ATPase/permease subunit